MTKKSESKKALEGSVRELQARLASAGEAAAVLTDQLLAEKAAHKATKDALVEERRAHMDQYAKSVGDAREDERKRRATAYEAMTLYAAKLRSGLMLLVDSSEPSAATNEQHKAYTDAVKVVREAKPPKEVRDALDIVVARMAEVERRDGRAHAIVSTMLDATVPKVETDSIAPSMWAVLAGTAMVGFAAYAMLGGMLGSKAGKGWGGT